MNRGGRGTSSVSSLLPTQFHWLKRLRPKMGNRSRNLFSKLTGKRLAQSNNREILIRLFIKIFYMILHNQRGHYKKVKDNNLWFQMNSEIRVKLFSYFFGFFRMKNGMNFIISSPSCILFKVSILSYSLNGCQTGTYLLALASNDEIRALF